MPKITETTTINIADQVGAMTSAIFGRETSAPLNSKVGAILNEYNEAKKAVDQKQKDLEKSHEATGQPLGILEFGDNGGYFCRYQNGNIYIKPPAGPCWVHGAILDKYLKSFNGPSGFLGYPLTDELTTPDTIGRYNHFEQGSIYYTYDTHAHEIHGEIRRKWAALGWETSWLGYPTSDEHEAGDGGRCSNFQHGNIWWWPDPGTGAYDMANICVNFKGLYCFGETAAKLFGGSSDSPYVIFGELPVPPNEQTALRTEIYNDVDSGDSRPAKMELYRGIPGGMGLNISLFVHHPRGDPDLYLSIVKEGVVLAGKGVSAGCGEIFGADATPVCQRLWDAAAPKIVEYVNGQIPEGDTLIRSLPMNITNKDMVTMANTPRQNFWGIEYHLESELLSDGDASYKVYFDIERVV